MALGRQSQGGPGVPGICLQMAQRIQRIGSASRKCHIDKDNIYRVINKRYPLLLRITIHIKKKKNNVSYFLTCSFFSHPPGGRRNAHRSLGQLCPSHRRCTSHLNPRLRCVGSAGREQLHRRTADATGWPHPVLEMPQQLGKIWKDR